MNDFPNFPRTAPWAGAARSWSADGADDKTGSLGWSDPALGAGIGIVGDPSLSARGLSVQQHAERVLGHLRGERDAVD